MGVIQEQGDLGLGFNPITPEEEKIVKESFENDQAPSDSEREEGD